MKFAALSCGALLCTLAPSVTAVPANEGTVPPTPGFDATREVEDLFNEPFVQAYLESRKAKTSTDDQSSDAPDFKIVNGTPVKSSLPWFASMNMITNFQPNGKAQIGLCGGSLINSQYVLTAAHCFYQEGGTYMKPELLKVGPGANDVLPNIVVQLGGTEQHFMIANGMVRRSAGDDEPASVHTRATSSETVQIFGGAQVICHPKYDPARQNNDICLIKLDGPSTQPNVKLNFETSTRTAAQVAANEEAGQAATAYGFGDTSFQGSMSPILLQATMPIVGLPECKKQWATAMFGAQAMFIPSLANRVLGDGVICADSTNADTCQGDSGGPLVNAKSGAQIGVTSVGIDCKSGIPGVYTKVSAYQSWILQTAGPAGA